ncbi:MAG: tyrosine-type recombinase/integrase [Leptolyngbya sp. SIOISBB]|nr:tyrosine-type recombinase/integrase [Leptolyngbya sp. SIOISBB]
MSQINIFIEEKGKYLRLRWKYQGTRFSLSDGFTNNSRGRKRAEATATQIENDILAKNFDKSLERYRIKKPKANASLDHKLTTIYTLWTAYLREHKKTIKASTYHKQFKPIDNYLTTFKSLKIEDSDRLTRAINRDKSPDMSRRILTRLSAAFKWGVSMGLCDENPFDGVATAIKVNRKRRGKKGVDPFTVDERNRITRYFYAEKPDYAPFVEFLFLTGCRPSEAIALEWDNVFAHCIVFDQVAVQGVPGESIQEGTKTEPMRRFPVNEQLKELLLWVESKDLDPTGLVFKSPEGKLLSLSNFTRRHWKKALEDLGIKHRKLYQTRHSFITLCLDKGIDAKDVAKWVGNSPEMIYRHYAGRNPNLDVPEL